MYVRTYVRPSTILIFRIWIRWNFFQEVGNSIESFSEGRLKRFEFYANFAKLKRRLRSFRLKRSEAYAKSAKLSTLIRNFTVCNSVRFRVYVINAKFSALNFTSVKFAKLSSQTLRKSSSFRTPHRLHELELAKLLTLNTLCCEKCLFEKPVFE